MPRIPLLRTFVPRVSVISRPLLPLSSRAASISTQSSSFFIPRSIWRPQLRMFSYTPLRTNSPSPPSSPSSSSLPPGPGPNASFSQRLKHLIKTYGWYALGVYLILSAVDFSVAFAGINIIGAEQVSRVTLSLKEYFASYIHSTPAEPGQELDKVPPGNGREGLYAMLVLAYTIHKTLFLPLRVGLTAAITPKVVGWLARRGWVGGEGAKRAMREMRQRSSRGVDND